MQVSTIGLDIAKNVFQVHGVDEEGKVVITRQLRRGQVIVFFKKLAPCLIGMEACATAHDWGRAISSGLEHDVRLLPPIYVKPFVRRHKNDAADATRLQSIEAAEHALDSVAVSAPHGPKLKSA